jgi:hypothetical protein
VEAEVLAVPGTDHLHRLRETVADAQGKRHGGQSEGVDGDGHAHATEDLGHACGGQVVADLEGEVGENRGNISGDVPGIYPRPVAAAAGS